MSQVYNKLKIDIKEPITDIITAKQNDSESRFLDVYLYDSGVAINLTGHEVRIYMRKPDGKEVFNNGEITDATSGRCQFELTDQALSAVGYLKCEISIWKDNTQILTTQTFNVFVTESLRASGSVESSNEYGALVVLYQNLYEAIDLMTTMAEMFGEPGDVAAAASIATFWQMLEYLYNVNKGALANASTQGVIDLIGATGNTGGSASEGTVMAKLNAAINYLANSTYGLNAIKTQVVKNQNWYAKYGTSTTLASKTTETAGISSNNTGIKITLLTVDIPESGMYQWSINGAIAGLSDTAGSYTNKSGLTNASAIVYLQKTGSRFNDYANGFKSDIDATLLSSTNYITSQNKSGYVYLQKGELVALRFGSAGNYNSGNYPWYKVASAYLKYVKQTI